MFSVTLVNLLYILGGTSTPHLPQNPTPTLSQFSGSCSFLHFFLFYNKLDLRKNCSPFISGGLMVSKRATRTIKTPAARGMVLRGMRGTDNGLSSRCPFFNGTNSCSSWTGLFHALVELPVWTLAIQ